jgi:hypothetical protein
MRYSTRTRTNMTEHSTDVSAFIQLVSSTSTRAFTQCMYACMYTYQYHPQRPYIRILHNLLLGPYPLPMQRNLLCECQLFCSGQWRCC